MSNRGGPPRLPKGGRRMANVSQVHDEGNAVSEPGRNRSKRSLNHPRREESRRFKDGRAHSKKTLQEVFNRASSNESRQPYRRQHPLSNIDIIKINAAIRHELYDVKGIEVGWLTFTQMQRKFPNLLRHIRKEIEKKYEVLQKCVAQWGVDWAIQRVLQRDRIYEPRSRNKQIEKRNQEKEIGVLERNATDCENIRNDAGSEEKNTLSKNGSDVDPTNQLPRSNFFEKKVPSRFDESTGQFRGSNDELNDQSGVSSEGEIQADDSDEEEIRPISKFPKRQPIQHRTKHLQHCEYRQKVPDLCQRRKGKQGKLSREVSSTIRSGSDTKKRKYRKSGYGQIRTAGHEANSHDEDEGVIYNRGRNSKMRRLEKSYRRHAGHGSDESVEI